MVGSEQATPPIASAAHHAHFVGICGAGMSGVARLLQEAGWAVTGSDSDFYPPVSDAIVAAGLSCLTPYAAANIPANARQIVIGKHAKLLPESNPEVAQAFALQVAGQANVLSYPEVLHKLTANTTNIVVAGSFGKSTTTALLTWVLVHAGKDPSYFIGAVPMDLPFAAHRGSGSVFVLEGDEYPSSNWDSRAKFLHYNPKTVVLTSCEHDHFNEFPTLKSYLAPFRELVRGIPEDGLLVACRDGASVADVAREARCRVVWYTASPNEAVQQECDYHLDTLAATSNDNSDIVTTHLTLSGANKANWQGVLSLRTHLLGHHNAENIMGAAAALLEMGLVTSDELATALAAFHGLRRRLERKSDASTIHLYEDLSSSRPKAVAALQAVRARHPQGRLIAVFQPHTFSFRSRMALEWYPGLFVQADGIIVFSPPNLHGLPPDDQLSHAEIVRAIQDGNTAPVTVAESANDVLTSLQAHLAPGDAVLLMTSGGMGGVIAQVQAFVEQKFPTHDRAT